MGLNAPSTVCISTSTLNAPSTILLFWLFTTFCKVSQQQGGDEEEKQQQQQQQQQQQLFHL